MFFKVINWHNQFIIKIQLVKIYLNLSMKIVNWKIKMKNMNFNFN